jgi:WD repeat-containing protein 19
LLKRKIPVLGKHTRRICTGCWSKDGLLALGGDDKILTISNENGDTVRQTSLRETPQMIKFSDRKQDVRSQLLEGTVSLILGKKIMFLFSIDDPDKPIELAFQSKYGEIVNYQWYLKHFGIKIFHFNTKATLFKYFRYGDGYIMIGFSLGFLIVISTHSKEIGSVSFKK